MRIVTWNMNHCKRSDKQRKKAWEYLHEELKADLALVQEAVPPADAHDSVYSPIDEKHPSFRWGSAVVALQTDLALDGPDRLPLHCCYITPPDARQLPDSHPGASAVAHVQRAGGKRLFAAISLYGQWEMMPGGKNMDSCARLHRMLSDLTGALASKKTPIIIAGDWNITTQGQKSAARQAEVVFARLRAWDLTDCVAQFGQETPPLEGCDCGRGDGCCHVRTYRHANKVDSVPAQLDYLFVSKILAPRVRECRVVDDEAAWALSDHCPIVLDLALD